MRVCVLKVHIYLALTVHCTPERVNSIKPQSSEVRVGLVFIKHRHYYLVIIKVAMAVVLVNVITENVYTTYKNKR